MAIEHAHLKWIFPRQVVIFHGYVGLPEGMFPDLGTFNSSRVSYHPCVGCSGETSRQISSTPIPIFLSPAAMHHYWLVVEFQPL